MTRKKNRKYTVYVHESPEGKKYVGITSMERMHDRWRNGKGYIYNTHFYSAILKYGWENFKHIIVAENLAPEQAFQMESDLIRLFNTRDKRFGYNNSDGGEVGWTGSVITEETRQKRRLAALRRKHTEESKRKISEGQLGNKNPNYKGRVLCVETGQVFESAAEAALFIGIARTNLYACLHGRRETFGGYHWKLKEM